jgi:hypothetical protein
MTEPLQPPEFDLSDLAASAALDGETLDPMPPGAPPVDDALVAARIDTFQLVSAAVAADIVLPEPAVRDVQLATALATALALSAESSAPSGSADGEVPTPPVGLASRRARPSRRRWIAIAAAAAVVALAIPFINAIQHQSSSVQTSASSAGPPSTAATADALVQAASTITPPANGPASSTSTSSVAPAPAPLASSTTTASEVAPGDLGPASSPQELADLIRAAEPDLLIAPASPTTTVPASRVAVAGGSHQRVQYAGLGALVLGTTAEFRGAPVAVLVYAVSTAIGSGHRLLAVTPGNCTTVVDLSL